MDLKEKTISITTTTNTHTVKDGVLNVKSDRLVPIRGGDGRMILRYYFDCAITLPSGVLGLVMPPQNSSTLSLSQVGGYVMFPGVNNEPFIDYKINTDAIPAVYEKDDFCASIIFLPIVTDYPGFKIETSIKRGSEDESNPQEDPMAQVEEQADVNHVDIATENLPEGNVSNSIQSDDKEAE